jgi:hypothetical protein
LSLSHDLPTSDAVKGSEPLNSAGRRSAVRWLAGIGTAGTALLGRFYLASPGSTAKSDNAASQGMPAINGAKNKKGKSGANASAKDRLTQSSQEFSVSAGANANGQANCLSGKATGGGVGVSNAACVVASSGPVGAKAWGATVACPGANSATATVTVICLK